MPRARSGDSSGTGSFTQCNRGKADLSLRPQAINFRQDFVGPVRVPSAQQQDAKSIDPAIPGDRRIVIHVQIDPVFTRAFGGQRLAARPLNLPGMALAVDNEIKSNPIAAKQISDVPFRAVRGRIDPNFHASARMERSRLTVPMRSLSEYSLFSGNGGGDSTSNFSGDTNSVSSRSKDTLMGIASTPATRKYAKRGTHLAMGSPDILCYTWRE